MNEPRGRMIAMLLEETRLGTRRLAESTNEELEQLVDEKVWRGGIGFRETMMDTFEMFTGGVWGALGTWVEQHRNRADRIEEMYGLEPDDGDWKDIIEEFEIYGIDLAEIAARYQAEDDLLSGIITYCHKCDAYSFEEWMCELCGNEDGETGFDDKKAIEWATELWRNDIYAVNRRCLWLAVENEGSEAFINWVNDKFNGLYDDVKQALDSIEYANDQGNRLAAILFVMHIEHSADVPIVCDEAYAFPTMPERGIDIIQQHGVRAVFGDDEVDEWLLKPKW